MKVLIKLNIPDDEQARDICRKHTRKLAAISTTPARVTFDGNDGWVCERPYEDYFDAMLKEHGADPDDLAIANRLRGLQTEQGIGGDGQL